VYSRIIEGEEFSFGVSGKLIMNVLVMYDRQTETLWSQLLGEAVEGPLKGTKLEFVPSWQTTWADWVTRNPDTIALDKGFGGSFDPYTSYYSGSSSGVIGRSKIDDRLYAKEFVVGIEQNTEAVAYPFSVLNDVPVVNDEVGGIPILVIFNTETGTGVVYDRRIDGEPLTFENDDGLNLKDSETGSLWDGLNGVATSGPMTGKRLTRLKSTSSFWFGWIDWYPDSRIYGLSD
jgi:hypothetical protein